MILAGLYDPHWGLEEFLLSPLALFMCYSVLALFSPKKPFHSFMLRKLVRRRFYYFLLFCLSLFCLCIKSCSTLHALFYNPMSYSVLFSTLFYILMFCISLRVFFPSYSSFVRCFPRCLLIFFFIKILRFFSS